MQTIKNLKTILILSALVGILMLYKVAQDRRWPGRVPEAAEGISQRTAFISADELQSGQGRVALIGAPRGSAGEESDSVKDFPIALFAYPAAEPTGNALTGIQLGDSKTGSFPAEYEVTKTSFDGLVSREMRVKLKQPDTRFVIVADSADQAVYAWVILHQLGVENLYVLENGETGGELFKYQFRPDTTFRPEPVNVEE